MSNQERTDYWRHQIKLWQVSDLSGARYCKDNDAHLNQFYYWPKQFDDKRIVQAQSKTPTYGFSSVVMSEPTAHEAGLRFTLPNGCAIEGISSSNIALAGALLAQL